MGVSLSLCPGCTRHVRAGESACPFCQTELPEGFGARAPGPEATTKRSQLTRAALLFAGASLTAACSSEPVAVYGPGPIRDAGGADASDGGGGPAKDAGGADASDGGGPTKDAGSDAAVNDGGGPVALYGPAPVRDADSDG